MSQLLVNSPDLRVFWSAYDPLDLASDSIDPLGFMGGYIALADRILPGLTTITTVPRYASMLCHALKKSRDAAGDGGGVSLSDGRRRIIEKIKLFERAWGLACGLAERDSGVGASATEGLRGVRAVHRWLDLNAQKEKLTLAFALLSNQVRYGGIGAYSTLLEALHLADMTALTLRPMGDALADSFPSSDDYNLDILRDGARLGTDDLQEWGRQAHVGILTAQEARLLRRALQGGEEAEFDDHTRWTMLRLLRTCNAQGNMEEPPLLASCLSRLAHADSSDSSTTNLANARIAKALRVIEPYERIYQCALFVFERIRSEATASGQVTLQAALGDRASLDACVQMRQSAIEFLDELETGSENHHGGLEESRQSLSKLGLVEFARTLVMVQQPVDFGQEILRRHLRVQEGKFDNGLPKGPWVRLESNQWNVARLSAQRFGLEGVQVPDSWQKMPRHPYRTSSANRFIKLCRIQ